MLSNTKTHYGGITKTFHWATVVMLLTIIPLGIYANGLPFDTGEALAQKAFVFSMHKTLGVTVFFLALCRIGWAFSQPRPGLLNADKPLEATLAETVHWLLYGSLILVPLSGWIHHAATEGFAPIWWPFGQSLPFVPKSAALAETFAGLHIIFERVLVLAFFLHLAGALKHHFIDRDQTLRRMLPGHTAGIVLPEQHRNVFPVIGAGAIWLAAVGVGAWLGLFAHEKTEVAELDRPALVAPESGWLVEEGTLAISVQQLGSTVNGAFEEWTAAINFDEAGDPDGVHGDVRVEIAISSLTLGSVTSQALGGDFLAAEEFPTAVFAAEITEIEDGYIAEGTLTLRDTEFPVRLPFTLQIDGDKAEMQGSTELNRTDFGIGQTYPDESSLGFAVNVDVALTAMRQE